MKVQPTVYKGIEFIRLPELPANQQMLLQHNTQVERIKILIDGKVNANCIQYKDYTAWYASVFVKSVVPVKEFSEPIVVTEAAMQQV